MPLLKFLDEHIEEYIVVVCLGTMSVLIFAQVFLRYVMENSLSWSEELSRYLLIWMVNVGISYAVKKKTHVRITALDTVLSPPLKKALDILSNLLILGFAGTITILSFQVVTFNFRMGQMSQALEFLPIWVVYLAVPVGFALTCFRVVQNLLTPEKPEDTLIL